jgi:hypothetical protein
LDIRWLPSTFQRRGSAQLSIFLRDERNRQAASDCFTAAYGNEHLLPSAQVERFVSAVELTKL